jgi:O-antigen/teichoic acid export membrane protein
MSLAARIVKVISFAFGQTIVSKLISAVSFALLVRLFTTDEIGMIGLAGSYLAFAGILFIYPETIFIRDAKKMEPVFFQAISSFFLFGVGRGLLLTGIGGLGAHILSTQGVISPLFAAYFTLALLANGIGALTGPFREAFYARFRQARIALVDATLSLVSLASIGVLWFIPSLLLYGGLLVLVALIGVLWWTRTAVVHLGFKFTQSPHPFHESIKAAKGFALWNQLSGSLLQWVYRSDVLVLGFFVGLTTIGSYTIALTIANVFFVIPQLVQKAVSLGLSQLGNAKDEAVAFGYAVKYNTIFTLLQWTGFLVLGWFIILFFGAKNPVEVWGYALSLVTGVTIFNLSRPWMSLLVVRGNQRKLFFRLFLPSGFLAVGVYALSAMYGGAVLVAQSNILVFALLGGGIIWYSNRVTKIYPRIHWGFEDMEKRLMKEIFLFGKKTKS